MKVPNFVFVSDFTLGDAVERSQRFLEQREPCPVCHICAWQDRTLIDGVFCRCIRCGYDHHLYSPEELQMGHHEERP